MRILIVFKVWHTQGLVTVLFIKLGSSWHATITIHTPFNKK
jgi:hypothetical protein